MLLKFLIKLTLFKLVLGTFNRYKDNPSPEFTSRSVLYFNPDDKIMLFGYFKTSLII